MSLSTMPDSLADAQKRLNAAQDGARRRAMGPPLRLSDGDLDTLSGLSDADVAAADALWRAANPGGLADLLDAEPGEDA
jgi:hypothetical protein